MENTTMHDKMHFTKGDVVLNIEIVVQMPTKDAIHNNWICNYFLNGNGLIHKDIFGASSIQALNLAMQMVKLHLMMLINDGYLMCYLDENEKVTNIESKKVSIRNLNATYGLTTLADKTHDNENYLQAIERLQEGVGTDEEQDNDINYLRKNLLDPKISDYIFHSKIEMAAEQILEKALSYKPILL